MSKLALHIHHFKKGAVGAVAGHNLYKRGKRDTHSNQDINPDLSQNNLALLVPEQSLYQEVKKAVGASNGRVTANSVWLSEWIIYPPEELQDPKTADPEKVEEYFRSVLCWLQANGYDVKMAVVHMDESTVHAHFDTVPLTQDNRLSRKELYTRSALSRIHTSLSEHLQKEGWDIQRGESTEGKQVKSKSVVEYKKQAEAEKKELLKEIEGLKETIQKQQQVIDSAAETVSRIIEIDDIEIKKIPLSADGRGNFEDLTKLKEVAAKDFALEHLQYQYERELRAQEEELEKVIRRRDDLIREKKTYERVEKQLNESLELAKETTMDKVANVLVAMIMSNPIYKAEFRKRMKKEYPNVTFEWEKEKKGKTEISR